MLWQPFIPPEHGVSRDWGHKGEIANSTLAYRLNIFHRPAHAYHPPTNDSHFHDSKSLRENQA